MKIWQKDSADTAEVDLFTVGGDRELDRRLALFDVLGSLAHTQMLRSIELLSGAELRQVQEGLKGIAREIAQNSFTIDPANEDIHSEIEARLTERLGDVGKKIHSGRSRNDQVLLDLRLYFRSEIHQMADLTKELFQTLQTLAAEHKDTLMPGYTHLQVAMPSSFGLWFGAWAESLTDDLQTLLSAYKVCNRNPLGSGAGYGSSFALDRQMTTDLLGFDAPSYNVVYAQMGRGKTERILANAMANIALTLEKLAMDNALYLSQNFAFISYPDSLTTGSSIMPHKKNPDVWEIMRGRCNLIASTPMQVNMLTGNLPSGYHRDLQLLKEIIFPAITSLKECLTMAKYMLEHIQVRADILKEEKYRYIFSVEAVNQLAQSGIPFRDAYRQVGLAIGEGTFQAPHAVNHTHLGSIGNLCLEPVAAEFAATLAAFNFDKIEAAQKALLD
ncbi:MAG: argininosuccinate lyase [Mucinivorans sp.]